MALPERKRLRLKDYDYSQNGAYFLTVCAKDKKRIFGRIVGDGVLDVPHTQLSHIGKVINKYVISIDATYTDISVKKYVIMPNHIHLLILIDCENSNSANLSVPSLISTLKRFVNREIGFNVWQRSYHDHVIRNMRDYEEIWQYIDENPFRWESDCYY